MSKWISVEDRLPDGFGWFLVFDESMADNHEITLGFYEGVGSMVDWLPIDQRIDTDSMQVTHWMPLPEPPK